jgi:hypothetical protein
MTQNSRQPGSDPLGDFQRWLLRSSARGFGRDVRGNLRKTFGYGADGRDDVWESATNEPPGGEPPECEWCPLCRAARKFKDSGPGLGSHLSSVGDVFATVVQDAVDAFEAVIAARPGPGMPPDNASPGESADTPDPATPAGGADPDAHAAAAAADPAPDGDAHESAAAAGEPGGADAEQQAETGGSQERPASGPDDRS